VTLADPGASDDIATHLRGLSVDRASAQIDGYFAVLPTTAAAWVWLEPAALGQGWLNWNSSAGSSVAGVEA
jgi:hypothetical protein